MSRHNRLFAATALLAALPVLLAGCGDDDNGTAPIETEETMEAPTTAAPDIRREDLTEQAGLAEFLAQAGGALEKERILYADLTEDGLEEAVAPVSSGGEGGDIAVFVFGYGPDGLTELLRVLPEEGSLAAELVDGALTVTEPIFAADDPLCCPSQLRTTTYAWDGSQLAVQDERLEDQPTPKDRDGGRY